MIAQAKYGYLAPLGTVVTTHECLNNARTCKRTTLTHLSLASVFRDTGKQCKTKLDATERGV